MLDFEELNNAEENAEYLGAIKTDGKKSSTKAWEWPTPEELKSFHETLKSKSPEKLSNAYICSGSLGFYMYTDYIQQCGDGVKASFLVEVAVYRNAVPSSRLSIAMRILDEFLSQLPLSNNLNIVDPTLARNPTKTTSMTFPDKEVVWSDFLSLGGSVDNPLGIYGYPPEIVRAAIFQASNGNFCGLQPIVEDLEKSNIMKKSPPQISKRNSLQILISHVAPNSSKSSLTTSAKPISRRNSSVTEANIKGGGGLLHNAKVSPNDKVATTWPSLSSKGSQQSPGGGHLTDNSTSMSSSKVAPQQHPNSSSKDLQQSDGLTSDVATSDKMKHRNSSPIFVDSSATRAPSSILPPDLFDLMERIVFEQLKEQHFTSFLAASQFHDYLQYCQISTRPVTPEDFTLMRTLGRGGFGIVSGCQRKQTAKVYAQKVMNKKRVKSKRSEVLCMNEREILALVDSPFVVCLRYSFHTPADLYLILDLMSGGDLRFHLMNTGTLPLIDCKYYTVRTVLGIAALHAQGIAYRDLKPENILMSDSGITKISDLGLAVIVKPGAALNGACGTRGYQAPEMLTRNAQGKRNCYNLPVDWFAMGCCIAEFLQGDSPFSYPRVIQWAKLNFPLEGVNYDVELDKETYKNVYEPGMQRMEPDLDKDKITDPLAIDLINKLLRKNPDERLGSGPRGYKDILDHEWFKGLDISSIEQETYEPPFCPSKSLNMMSQDEIGVHEDDIKGGGSPMNLTVADQAVYENWDFISAAAFQSEVVDLLLIDKTAKGSKTIPLLPTKDGCCIIT